MLRVFMEVWKIIVIFVYNNLCDLRGVKYRNNRTNKAKAKVVKLVLWGNLN